MNRAKALFGLLWPCLAFGVVVFLSSALTHARPAAVTSTVNGGARTSQGGWLFANTASSADATVEITQSAAAIRGAGKNLTATTVTTYTVVGTF